MSEFQIVYRGGVGEIVEKKSRFIATVVPVANEDEALQFIEQTKKQYWDARHNCSAYVIGPNNEITHCSDDGEPAKTAGRPILDVILGEGIHNVCVVVTRYFGGVLLGTGGLVRAYQGAAKAGLEACSIITRRLGVPITVATDYNSIGKLQYITAQMNLTTLSTEFTEQVLLKVLAPSEDSEAFQKKVTEATSGRALITAGDPVWYGETDGQVILFDE